MAMLEIGTGFSHFSSFLCRYSSAYRLHKYLLIACNGFILLYHIIDYSIPVSNYSNKCESSRSQMFKTHISENKSAHVAIIFIAGLITNQMVLEEAPNLGQAEAGAVLA